MRATGRVEASGNCTNWVLPVAGGPLRGSARAVHERFTQYGLGGEEFSAELPLVAFDVPAGSDFAGIKSLLASGRAEGWWVYEEGYINDTWRDADPPDA